MSYNYVLKMTPVSEESIIDGTAQQNRCWIKKHYPCRVEYIGHSENDIDGYTHNLLVTGLSKNVTNLNDFKHILSDFLSQVEFKYSQYWKHPFVSLCSVTSQEVTDLYKSRTDKTDVDWTLDVDNLPPDEKKNFYTDIKQLYYNYHLEFLLYSGLREGYNDYMKTVLPSLSIQQSQILKKNIKEVNAKGKLLGLYKNYVPIRMEENKIVYGKYHISVCPPQAIIPNYGENVPNVQTRIEDFAFDGCDNLKSIKIWEKISHFGKFVFRGCTSLEKVELNNNMEIIPENTFLNCISLKEVAMPESIKVIDEHAFNNCQALESNKLVAHTHLERIRGNAFANCSSLKNIILPENLIEIGEYAFTNSGLEQITLPNKVKYIGPGVFLECHHLKHVMFPNGISEIPCRCFENCTELMEVMLPRKITKICSSAFENCEKVEKIVIPQGVQEIDDDVFKGCTALKQLVLPASVVLLGDCDFSKNTVIYCKKNSYVHKIALSEEWKFELI